MAGRRWRVACVLLSLALAGLPAASGVARAEGAEQPAEVTWNAPAIQAVRADTPPTIDGRLDDPCWERATHVTEFYRERVFAPALEATEAWVCYDEEHIYVAFRCHDPEPSRIRAMQRKRQGQISRDDRVSVAVEVSGQGTSWYSFQVTAGGTQFDEVPGGTSEKIEWKGDWRAAAEIGETGWTAEIAIPFSILRYPNGQKEFGLILFRVFPRGDNVFLWPPSFARVQEVENRARWQGVEAPPAPLRRVLMPYAVSVLSRDENGRDPLEMGVDAKAIFPSGAVALATYHPDFRNLEDVVETIDFTYVERFLPEYRPFFQEGMSFLPPEYVLYTRRIRELDAGVKSFGQLGRHQYGVLETYRRGGENHFAGAYQYQVTQHHAVRLFGVDRRASEEPHNQAFGAESYLSRSFEGGGRYGFVSAIGSRTEGEGGDDSMFSLGTGMHRQQGWGYHVGYNATGEEFRADAGYVPETGVRNVYGEVRHRRNYDEGPVRFTRWSFGGSRGRSQEGERWNLRASHVRGWRSERDIWLRAGVGERDGWDESTWSLGWNWRNQDIYRRGQMDFTWGERYQEPYRYQGLAQSFRPAERWSVELRAERSFAVGWDEEGELTPPQWQRLLVLTTGYDVTDERTISGRLVRSGGSTNMYAAYRQRVRRGADLLVVVGDPNAQRWVTRLAVKALWCL